MNSKKSLIVLISLLILLIFFITAGLLLTSKKKINNLNSNRDNINSIRKVIGEENLNSTKQELISASSPLAIENIIGQITKIDIGAINITTSSGQQLTVLIPKTNVAFFKQNKGKDGSFNNKPIGLFEIPLNKDVSIQYNSVTNELRMIVISE